MNPARFFNITAVFLTLGLSAGLNAQTVVNGGFEDDRVHASARVVGIPYGWTADKTTIVEMTSDSAPNAVRNVQESTYLENGFSGDTNVVFQEIGGFVIGATYELFYFYGNSSDLATLEGLPQLEEPDEMAINVSIAGIGQNHNGPAGFTQSLKPASIVFRATAAKETIRIKLGGAGSSVDGFFLKQISTPIPEPSSLMLIGFAGCGLVIRRRK